MCNAFVLFLCPNNNICQKLKHLIPNITLFLYDLQLEQIRKRTRVQHSLQLSDPHLQPGSALVRHAVLSAAGGGCDPEAAAPLLHQERVRPQSLPAG